MKSVDKLPDRPDMTIFVYRGRKRTQQQQFVILESSGLFRRFYSICDGKSCLKNNVDPDQTPHYVASDVGFHCLPTER